MIRFEFTWFLMLGSEFEIPARAVSISSIWMAKFPLAPMGVLVPGSAHARPSTQPPIDTSGNFLAHMSAESPSNISPNPSEVISEVSEP